MSIIPFPTTRRTLPGFTASALAGHSAATPAVTKQPVKPLDQLLQSKIQNQQSEIVNPPPLTRDQICKRGYHFLKKLTGFIGGSQLAAVKTGLRGEEGEWFMHKMEELAGIVEKMPVTYGQDGKGDDAIVYLHYFTGPYDGYLTEKDMEEPENPAEAQWQAYGRVHWAQNSGHLSQGYICLPEIFKSHAELDFHFTPCTGREIKAKHGVECEPSAGSADLQSAPEPEPFPITLIGDPDHPEKQAQAIGRFTRQIPGWSLNSDSEPQASITTPAQPPLVMAGGNSDTPPTDEPPVIQRQKQFLTMADPYQPGAILCSSWGWEQTNIDFYRIEKRAGLMLTLAPLQNILTESGFMSGTRLPTDQPKDYATDHDTAWGNKDLQNPKPTFKRKLKLGSDGKPNGLVISHGWCRLWEARPMTCSWYG